MIVTTCNNASVAVINENYEEVLNVEVCTSNVQEMFAPDVDLNVFTAPYENLRDIIAGDEVFVLSPYLLVQYLPYFMQVEPIVQEIVRPHLEMNSKFRNKNFAIN